MHEVVDTPIGSLVIDCDGTEVEVAFKQSVDGVVGVALDGNRVRYSIGRKPPKEHSEITQNGSTFEVIGVRMNGDGYDVLNGNTGVWEKWVEA